MLKTSDFGIELCLGCLFDILANLALVWISLALYCSLFENNGEQWKDNENNRNRKKFSYRCNTLKKTKILTKFRVYVLICSHFTAISSI